MATEGGEAAEYFPDALSEDADVVITTVVSADDPRPEGAVPAAGEGAEVDDLAWAWDDSDDQTGGGDIVPGDPGAAMSDPDFAASDFGGAPDFGGTPDFGDPDFGEGDPAPAVAAPASPDAEADLAPPPPPPETTAIEARLAALEAVPGAVDRLGAAIRHELERCAGVLFAHDRALGALSMRLDTVESSGADPAGREELLAERARVAEETVARMLDQLTDMDRRLVVMENRVEPLEPLPSIVAALRRAVRASDDVIAGEITARETAIVGLAAQQATDAQSREDELRRLLALDLDRLSTTSSAQARAMSELADRLVAAEGRLAPLDTMPDDVAALGRLLRRELDAVVTDNQARDQMLRRALQNELDQFRAVSDEREESTKSVAGRLDAVGGPIGRHRHHGGLEAS